jgi:hypothetical protein
MIDPGIAIGGDQKVRPQIQKLLLHQHHRNWLVKRASRITWKDRRAVRHWRSSRRCQSIEMRPDATLKVDPSLLGGSGGSGGSDPPLTMRIAFFKVFFT